VFKFDVDVEYRAAVREVNEWALALQLGLEPAQAGDGLGNVDVSGRSGWIYVRRIGSSDIFQARNLLGYKPLEDDYIIIKKDREKGYEIWEVISVDVAGVVYAQPMFCVPGALSVGLDVASWFRCSAPNGIQLLWVVIFVKTPPSGGTVICDIQLSEDCGGTFTTIFGGGIFPTIADGDRCSSQLDLGASDTTIMAQGDILRLDNTAVNGAEWLVASVGVRQL